MSSGPEAQVTEAGDYRFFAGWRSDPFFYDVGGALNDFQFTGSDYFADKDVCSIVLELPNNELGSTEVGLWHRALVPEDGAGWVQVDRGLEPSRSPSSSRTRRRRRTSAAIRRVTPASWTASPTRWSTQVGARRRRPSGWRSLCCQMSCPTTRRDRFAYPDNGRLFTDDVGDYLVAILTNGRVTEDKVGPHDDPLLPEFPTSGRLTKTERRSK